MAASYTKKGSGRTHNHEASLRTQRSGEVRGCKIARKAKRKILTVRNVRYLETIAD